MAQPRKTYVVLVPFPYRGHWTAKGQKLDLLPCEAAQLLRAGRLGDPSTQAAKKTAEKKAD
jgi:hypothetical protein